MTAFRVKPLRAAARAVALVLTRTPLLDALVEAAPAAAVVRDFQRRWGDDPVDAGGNLRLAAALLDRATRERGPLSLDGWSSYSPEAALELLAGSRPIRDAAANAHHFAVEAIVAGASKRDPASRAFAFAALAVRDAASAEQKLAVMPKHARERTNESRWVVAKWRKSVPEDLARAEASLRQAFDIYGDRGQFTFDATYADALAQAERKTR